MVCVRYPSLGKLGKYRVCSLLRHLRMEIYRYTPLNRFDASVVRLLELSPRSRNDQLHGNLHHYLLNNIPAYSAPSYVCKQEASQPNPGCIGFERRLFRLGVHSTERAQFLQGVASLPQ